MFFLEVKLSNTMRLLTGTLYMQILQLDVIRKVKTEECHEITHPSHADSAAAQQVDVLQVKVKLSTTMRLLTLHMQILQLDVLRKVKTEQCHEITHPAHADPAAGQQVDVLLLDEELHHVRVQPGVREHPDLLSNVAETRGLNSYGIDCDQCRCKRD